MRKLWLFVLIVCAGPLWLAARAQEKEPVRAKAKSWGYASSGPIEVREGASSRKKVVGHLGCGALVAVLDEKTTGGTGWSKVRFVDPAKLTEAMGWVESAKLEEVTLQQFPSDDDLLEQIGGPYLEDIVRSGTAIARTVLPQGRGKTALVCLLGTMDLPDARLQAFMRSGDEWTPGPYLEFPRSEMEGPVSDLEAKDLLGDGNECLITHEAFHLQVEDYGTNIVIRRIQGGAFKTLWQAPLEHINLASFSPKRQKLEPPEKNLGAPGTVTKATVDFRADGRISEPVWKAKIEFHVAGREKPLEVLSVEKTCRWNGSGFDPVN